MKDKITAIIKESLKSETGAYSARVISAAVLRGDDEFVETFDNINNLSIGVPGIAAQSLHPGRPQQ